MATMNKYVFNKNGFDWMYMTYISLDHFYNSYIASKEAY